MGLAEVLCPEDEKALKRQLHELRLKIGYTPITSTLALQFVTLVSNGGFFNQHNPIDALNLNVLTVTPSTKEVSHGVTMAYMLRPELLDHNRENERKFLEAKMFESKLCKELTYYSELPEHHKTGIRLLYKLAKLRLKHSEKDENLELVRIYLNGGYVWTKQPISGIINIPVLWKEKEEVEEPIIGELVDDKHGPHTKLKSVKVKAVMTEKDGGPLHPYRYRKVCVPKPFTGRWVYVGK
jgi:hypothetical protein